MQSRTVKLLISILGALLFSCDQPAIYNQYQVIDDGIWAKDKVYYFTFDIENNDIAYDVVLDIRNNNKYPYQNLWLFCNEEPPIGKLRKDTTECLLADEFGKWYGRGISLYESSFPIRNSYLFPYSGQYTFSFRQGMRDSTIIGIQEIGLRVVPTVPFSQHPSGEK